jgi:hypothetical protein
MICVQNTQKDREERIWKLLMKRCPYREICKIERCLPNEVSRVYKKKTNENRIASSIEEKGKSICSQVFDLLEKHIPLTQIIIKLDIDPEEAMRLEDKYLHVLKRNQIVNLLNNQPDMDLTIEIVEFLQANSNQFDEIKEVKDLQILKSNLMYDLDEIKDDIKVNKTLLKHFDKQINEKQKELGLEQY